MPEEEEEDLYDDNSDGDMERTHSVMYNPSSPLLPKQGMNRRLLFAIGAAALGSAFQHGYNTGVVNSPQSLIENWIKETKTNRSSHDDPPISDSTVTLIWSTAVALFCVGGMIGGSVVGVVADRAGRRGGLLLNNILVFIAAVLMGFSKAASSYEMLILGRFVIGINCGLNAGLVPMYLAEISPTSLRGAVGSVYQLVITISILISQLLGLKSALGTDNGWPLLLAITAIPAIIQVIMLPFCPESPKHILQSSADEVKAKQVLSWLRNSEDVQAEMEEIKAEKEATKLAPKVSLKELISNPALRIPLIISVSLMLAQQLSGINAAFYFSTSIFEKAQLSSEAAQYATLGMGGINVLMTLVSVVLVEKAGRKTLLLVGFSGMFIATIFLTACLANVEMIFVSYLSVALVLLFVIFFATGPGSIPWFMVSELFSQNARPSATSVAVAINWAANFVVSLGFLPLQQLLGPYVFLIFAGLQFIFILFIFKKVPETKNKTSEEIAAMFRQISYQ